MALHQETKELLREEKIARIELEKRIENLEYEKRSDEEKFDAEIEKLKEELKRRDIIELEKKVKQWGWISSLALFGIPYIILIAITELFKARFSDISFISVVCIAVLIIVGIIALMLFQRGKHGAFQRLEQN